jgi:hypothetical protein
VAYLEFQLLPVLGQDDLILGHNVFNDVSPLRIGEHATVTHCNLTRSLTRSLTRLYTRVVSRSSLTVASASPAESR